MAHYRLRKVTKRVNGKLRRYSNLAVFNRECSTRSLRGNICDVVNIRCLKDGGGLATVKTRPGVLRARPAGTWLLHFASCSVLKRHLRGRT